MRTKETYPDKEVDHEENIESKINLLGSVHCPRYTRFNSVTENRKINKKNLFFVQKWPKNCSKNYCSKFVYLRLI